MHKTSLSDMFKVTMLLLSGTNLHKSLYGPYLSVLLSMTAAPLLIAESPLTLILRFL